MAPAPAFAPIVPRSGPHGDPASRGVGEFHSAERESVRFALQCGSFILIRAVDVPVQYFQSVIAIELAVTGALLWQIRFFESGSKASRKGENLPDPRLRLGLALVLGATLFGSLWAMADDRQSWAATAVTVGLAVSLVPILLRVLPPLAKDAATNERDPNYAVTVVGLLLYVAVVAGFLVLLDLN